MSIMKKNDHRIIFIAFLALLIFGMASFIPKYSASIYDVFFIRTSSQSAESQSDSTLHSSSYTITDPGGISVHFIDVGQGDSILIKSATKAILIDAGERGETVPDYLKSLGISSLDLVVGTHPHADHIGGLINVLASIDVKEVLDPGVVHTTQVFEDYLNLIDTKNIKFTEARAGKKYDFGDGLILDVLHPFAALGDDLNSVSIVVRVTYGKISFLLSGDAEQDAEAEIINSGVNIQSTILKVGHHGSRTSTSQVYLNAINPEAAIIMCGIGNTYGHPHKETLDKLLAKNITIYRTDLNGDIVIITDGDTYSVTTGK